MDDVRRIPFPRLHLQIKGMEEFLKATHLDKMLEMGAFIAGGFPRHCMITGRVDPEYFDRSEKLARYSGNRYVELGDVDVFFHSEAQFWSCYNVFADHIDREVAEIRLQGKHYNNMYVSYHTSCFAHNAYVQGIRLKDLKNLKRTVKFPGVRIQFINCAYGDPLEILGNFDMRNSMIGFDKDNTYSFVNRTSLEERKLIGLNPTKYLGVTLARRLAKYFHKYDYQGLSPDSIPALERLCLSFVCSELDSPIESDLPTQNNFAHSNGDMFNPYVVRKEVLARKLITILPDHLLKLFVNRMYDTTYDSYSQIRTKVDVAQVELQTRQMKQKTQ